MTLISWSRVRLQEINGHSVSNQLKFCECIKSYATISNVLANFHFHLKLTFEITAEQNKNNYHKFIHSHIKYETNIEICVQMKLKLVHINAKYILKTK